MNQTKSKQVVTTVSVLVIIAIAIGIYLFFIYKKTHAGIVLQCEVMSVPLSRQFTALPRPNDLPVLDEFGCYVAEDGCACAKVSPTGNGIVFGVSRADSEELRIPETQEDRKKFLASLGMFVRTNSATGTVVTSEMTSFQDLESVSVRSLLKDESQKVIEARNIYFIYKDSLININFQTEQATFATYWPDIEKSLNAATFK